MKRRYIWFAIIAIFYVFTILNGNYISGLVGIGVLSFVLYFTNSIQNSYKADGPLTKNEKVIVWITVFLNPLIAQAFYYYCWKNAFPIRAAQANKYGWIAFFVMLLIGFIFGFSGAFLNNGN